MRVTLSSGTAAELALPDGREPVRGVALAADIGGLRPLFDELSARLASDYGWAVCAVEPFPGREQLSLEERFAAMPALEDQRQVGDLLEAADLLAERGGADRIAVMGFCMGGMYALKAAGTSRFDKAVAFYGMIRVPADWRGGAQGEPLDAVAKQGAAPVLAIIGERDPYTPPDDVAALAALPNVTVARYAEAEHGFVHDPSRPAHRADDAADAWRRVAEFLA
jgi:carboxymethylenebutenolidase